MIDVAKVKALVASLPLAHKVMIVAAVGVLGLAAVAFFRWVATPAYTVLYSDLDPEAASEVVEELDALGVDYELDGRTVQVSRERVHEIRATLAGEGVAGTPQVPGYELMDEQGLSVSEFRQQIDYQRALEGELTRTLEAMRDIDSASVHVSVPEDEVFAEDQEPVTASVMVGTRSELPPDKVESVAFTVASAVEGLDAGQVTVTDTEGRTLHSPETAGSSAGLTSRQMRQTREFEQTLADDVTELLRAVTGDDRQSVVVRTTLDYDEVETETETHDPDSQVALREQEQGEAYTGTDMAPGGAVGLDGGPLEGGEGGEIDYERDERTTEYGVDRVVERVTSAPGAVEEMSVAVVMDDGSVTGADVPPLAEVEELLTAALNLDEERGDDIAVSTLPFPEAEPGAPEPEEPAGWTQYLSLIVAAVVIVLIALALFFMARRRSSAEPALEYWEPVADDGATQQLAGAAVAAPEPAPSPQLEPSGAARLSEQIGGMVEQQPEEIAHLLRSWLADES